MFEKLKKLNRKRRFAKHFRENLRIGLIAAIGFVIAFAWREAILSLIDSFVYKYINPVQGVISETISALVITLIGVILIWIITKWLR